MRPVQARLSPGRHPGHQRDRPQTTHRPGGPARDREETVAPHASGELAALEHADGGDGKTGVGCGTSEPCGTTRINSGADPQHRMHALVTRKAPL